MSIVRTEQESVTVRYYLSPREILRALEGHYDIVYTGRTRIHRPDPNGQFVVETTYESSVETPAPLRGGDEPLTQPAVSADGTAAQIGR